MTSVSRNGATLAVRAVMCPVHGRIVPLGADGRPFGRCDMCVEEAERGLQILMEIARRKAEEESG